VPGRVLDVGRSKSPEVLSAPATMAQGSFGTPKTAVRHHRSIPPPRTLWIVSSSCVVGIAVAAFWPAPNVGPGPTFLWETSRLLSLVIVMLIGVSSVSFSAGILAWALLGRPGSWLLGGVLSLIALVGGGILFVVTLVFGFRRVVEGTLVIQQAYPQPIFLAGWGFVSILMLMIFYASSSRWRPPRMVEALPKESNSRSPAPMEGDPAVP
jgi:hypothetical protein